MEKTNGYYVGIYLKNNGLALVCELIVVLLLSLICTIIMDGQPMWLAPTMATITYLIAEIRFMMAYVATNARYDHEMAMIKGDADAGAGENEDQTKQEAVETADEPAVVAAAVVTTNELPDEDEPVVQKDGAPEICEQQCEEQAAAEEDEAVAEEEQEPEESVWDDLFAEPAPAALDEQNDDEALPAETVMIEQAEAEKPDENEPEEPEMVLESIEIDEDALNDMTMDDDEFSRDVLEIGEIQSAESNSDEDDALF